LSFAKLLKEAATNAYDRSGGGENSQIFPLGFKISFFASFIEI
jgi:hypothetical protein